MPEKAIEAARSALKVLLDEAEARSYNPPVNPEVVARLEYIIRLFEG